jgi:hypothetical protein
MEDASRSEEERRNQLELLRASLREKAKLDPEFAIQLEAAEHIMDKYSEALKRLADS